MREAAKREEELLGHSGIKGKIRKYITPAHPHATSTRGSRLSEETLEVEKERQHKAEREKIKLGERERERERGESKREGSKIGERETKRGRIC